MWECKLSVLLFFGRCFLVRTAEVESSNSDDGKVEVEVEKTVFYRECGKTFLIKITGKTVYDQHLIFAILNATGCPSRNTPYPFLGGHACCAQRTILTENGNYAKHGFL